MPWRCSRVGQLARGGLGRLRRVGRAAPRRRGSSMCCASAPGYSPAIVATTWRGRSVVSSAHSTTAPRERSQPSRPARRTISDRVHVGPRAQLLEERAAQVLLDLLARLLDGHLGEAGDRREVQELERLARRPRRAAARAPIVSSPEAIGTSPPTPGAPRRGGRAHVARRSGAARRRRPSRPATAPTGPSRGIDDRDGRARRLRGQLGHAAEAFAGQHRVHHLQVDRAQALDEAAAGAAGSGRPAIGSWAAPTTSYACAAKSGWACSVSSPDSPVRIR